MNVSLTPAGVKTAAITGAVVGGVVIAALCGLTLATTVPDSRKRTDGLIGSASMGVIVGLIAGVVLGRKIAIVRGQVAGVGINAVINNGANRTAIRGAISADQLKDMGTQFVQKFIGVRR